MDPDAPKLQPHIRRLQATLPTPPHVNAVFRRKGANGSRKRCASGGRNAKKHREARSSKAASNRSQGPGQARARFWLAPSTYGRNSPQPFRCLSLIASLTFGADRQHATECLRSNRAAEACEGRSIGSHCLCNARAKVTERGFRSEPGSHPGWRYSRCTAYLPIESWRVAVELPGGLD